MFRVYRVPSCQLQAKTGLFASRVAQKDDAARNKPANLTLRHSIQTPAGFLSSR